MVSVNFNFVFVFGANGDGSFTDNYQRHANRNYGAMYGVSDGPTGNAFAIRVRDNHRVKLDLSQIKTYIDRFCKYADQHPDKIFKVVSFPGFDVVDIAPLFYYAPRNIVLPLSYKMYISTDGIKRKYWMA